MVQIWKSSPAVHIRARPSTALLPYLSLGLNYVIYWVRIYGNKTRSFMQDGNFISSCAELASCVCVCLDNSSLDSAHILSANEIQLLLTPQGALFFLNRSPPPTVHVIYTMESRISFFMKFRTRVCTIEFLLQ